MSHGGCSWIDGEREGPGGRALCSCRNQKSELYLMAGVLSVLHWGSLLSLGVSQSDHEVL